MTTQLNRPQFIVLEGLDGSGKSTQAKRLAGRLYDLNIPRFYARQPSTNAVGQLARMATKGDFPLENEAIALLFAADRHQHYYEKIAPELERGNYVICDRYYYSNMAYQGTDAAAMERVIAYNQAVMTASAKRPDIVFFLDVPPKECMRRLSQRSDISIYETLPRLEQMRERYFAAFERLKKTDHIVIIDAADNSHESVAAQIWAHLKISE
ncbi:MAG: dTMP kinase [Defluviitaleaceae bacterium]|nr:dTMP kinase [Defluviitaleaceae bacterium]